MNLGHTGGRWGWLLAGASHISMPAHAPGTRPMAENKTKPTHASVEECIAVRGSESQRADCEELMAMLGRVTRQAPRMWGPSIIGYGAYRYTYESGRTGEAPVVGFAIRGRELVIYLLADDEEQRALLARLGRHRMGKVCLYIRRLADLDRQVLERLVANSVARVASRHGRQGAP